MPKIVCEVFCSFWRGPRHQFVRTKAEISQVFLGVKAPLPRPGIICNKFNNAGDSPQALSDYEASLRSIIINNIQDPHTTVPFTERRHKMHEMGSLYHTSHTVSMSNHYNMTRDIFVSIISHDLTVRIFVSCSDMFVELCHLIDALIGHTLPYVV